MLRHELGAALLFAVRDTDTVFIGLPSVVKDEILVHLIEKYQKAQQALGKASGEIRQIFGRSQEVEPRTSDEVRQAFEVRLQELRPRLEVIDCTEQDMLEAGRMVLAYRPPSTRTSQQYRDSVLWRSILRVAAANRVLFVTNDGGFYRGKNDDRPASEIDDEIGDLGLSIRFFRDVEILLDYFGDKPSLRTDEVSSIKANFTTAVAAAIGEALEQNGGYIVRQGMGCDIELYLTEDPHRLAISGNIEYELADPEVIDSADSPAAANASAIAAVELDDLDISDVQLDSLRVDAITPHGDYRIADIRYVRAADHIGVPWRYYALRTAAPKRASTADGVGPATSES